MATSRSRARRAPAARARRSGGGGFPVQAVPAIGAGVLIVAFALWMNSSDDKQVAPPPPPKAGPDIGWNHERVQATAQWMRMVAEDNQVDLAVSSDLDAFQRQLALEEARPVSSMSGDQYSALKDAILQRLTKGEATVLLREFEPYSGKLASEAMHTEPSGRAILEVQPRPEQREKYVSDATVEVSYRTEKGRTLVTGFQIVSPPREKPKPVVKSTAHHDQIGRPEKKVLERGGQKITVWEAEIVPLPHLADTPPELRTEIDRLVGELIRMDADMRPRERTKVKTRLAEIGKPAVPRLLTKFSEIAADEKGIPQLTQIDALLRDLSGQAFGFSPAHQTTLTSAKENEEARASALTQWYGWWFYFHDKPLDAGIDKEEDLLDMPAVKKNK